MNQFELLPELAGNPFLPRLFEMFDADQDGKISLSEFNAAIEFFLKLQNTSDKEECALQDSPMLTPCASFAMWVQRALLPERQA